MDQKLKDLLKEQTKDILSEENLQLIGDTIENLIQESSNVRVEAALAKQDAQHTTKLETLMEDIDTDHSQKLQQLLEAQEGKHTKMLEAIVNKYKKEVVSEQKAFKDGLVNKIDKFFDIVIEQQIPTEEIQEAVENVRSKKIIEQISKLIGVSKIQENSLVREGLMDAKSKIDTLTEKVNKLSTEKSVLLKEQEQILVEKLLSEKTQGLPKVKRDYIYNMLSNRSENFIKENFEYTLEVFDEAESSKEETIREKGKRQTKVLSEDIDRPEQIIEEQVDERNPVNGYLSELNKY